MHEGRGCKVGDFFENGKESYRGQGHDENNNWVGLYIDKNKSMPYYDSVHRYCWFETDEEILKILLDFKYFQLK